MNTTGYTQWFYFAVANTHPDSTRSRLCGFCGRRKVRCHAPLPQYKPVMRERGTPGADEADVFGASAAAQEASVSSVLSGSGTPAKSEGGRSDSDEPVVVVTTSERLFSADSQAAGSEGGSSGRANTATRDDSDGATGASAAAHGDGLVDEDDAELDANSDVSSEDDSGPSSDEDADENGDGGADGDSKAGAGAAPPVPKLMFTRKQPSRRSLTSVVSPELLYFCPAEHEVTFNIINMRKNGSLFNEGMLPVVYSVREAQESGMGWTRSGTNVKYAENEFVKGKKRRKRKAKHYSTLSFTLKFKHPGDVSLIAMSYP